MPPYFMLVPSQKHGAVASLSQVMYALAYVANHFTVDAGHVLYINGTRSAHKAEHVLPSSDLGL